MEKGARFTSLTAPVWNICFGCVQNSLGGNSRTLLLVAASPHEDNIDETFGTLDFAKRAREIKCTAKVNTKKNATASIPPKVSKEVLEVRMDGYKGIYSFVSSDSHLKSIS